MMRRLALLVAVVLALSACSGDELEGFLDLFPSEDLSQSDDPGQRAAGESAIEVLTIAEAEENLERGLAEGDVEAVRQAGRLRPDDPKYDWYEVALLTGEDLGADPEVNDRYQAAAGRAGFKFGAQHPEIDDPRETGRMAIEAYLNALRNVISRSPAGEGNDRRIEAYCDGISGFYPQQYTEPFPQEVSLFLTLEADFSLCA